MSAVTDLHRVIGANRNGWMPTFGFASHHIATAVVDGRLTDEDLERFVPYSFNEACAVARKCGIAFEGDAVTRGGKPLAMSYGGTLTTMDAEDVSISIESIKALRDESFRLEEGVWYFSVEDEGEIEGVRVDLVTLELMRRSLVKTYQDAAQLILDADAAFRIEVRA